MKKTDPTPDAEHVVSGVETALKSNGKAKKKKDKKKAKSDDAAAAVTGNGGGPSGEPHKVSRKAYEKELRRLQTEICKMQEWIKATGQRMVIVFEGRDAAGKGGLIRALTERVSPRVFRIVALPAPTEREKSQMYLQRFLQHFPAAGEVVIFDRSWYNRAGVERVMGFTTEQAYKKFLVLCPRFEQVIQENGIVLVKYWLEVGNDEQKKRFKARITDPLRQWKLSAMDLPSRERWYEYSHARDMMLLATDTDASPWHIVRSDDKKRARLNVLSHLLSLVPYKAPKRPRIKLPERSKKHAYDDMKPMLGRRWIPEVE